VHGPASGSGAGGFGTEPCQAARGLAARSDNAALLAVVPDAMQTAREARTSLAGNVAGQSAGPFEEVRSVRTRCR
jgi:hypothetical protein